MSIQGQFNQALGAVAAGAAMLKDEVNNSEKKADLLAKDADLSKKELANMIALENNQKKVDKLSNKVNDLTPNDAGLFVTSKGNVRKDQEAWGKKSKRQLPTAQHNLEIAKFALENSQKEQLAYSAMREIVNKNMRKAGLK